MEVTSATTAAVRQYRYDGGHARQSPAKLQVLDSSHWHVAIDLGGYSGTIRLYGYITKLKDPRRPHFSLWVHVDATSVRDIFGFVSLP